MVSLDKILTSSHATCTFHMPYQYSHYYTLQLNHMSISNHSNIRHLHVINKKLIGQFVPVLDVTEVLIHEPLHTHNSNLHVHV
jgi:hypothetical protein